ncbi:DUF397 domain-containing protein [Flindersiella endophytica]
MTDGSTWRVSSYSSSGGNNACVEVRYSVEEIAVRDSKDRGGPVLGFATADWRAFLRQFS